MRNLFAQAITLQNVNNKTVTENGANVYNTTGDALLDLFANIGSLRSRTDEEIQDKFAAAYAENPLLAMKMAFYTRNVRGGLGERRVSLVILDWLANNAPQALIKNLPFVQQFGRWDDFYTLIGTPAEGYMWTVISHQLLEDIRRYNRGESISLLAKWLKSENASSKETKQLARYTIKKLGLTPKQYRQTLSKLRAYIDIVESKMSNNAWELIDFNTVPSKAMMNYRTAFYRQSPSLFEAYINRVEAGEDKINSAALYPYEILERAELDYGYTSNHNAIFHIKEDRVLEAQWNSLPNYVEEPANFLVIADTSGSMIGRPMATSISLAVYFAERNKGAFHNLFMTFSSKPKFVELEGNTLAKKISCVRSIVDSTNLEAAFNLVLSTAIKSEVPQSDMPKALVVISDGEIDRFFHYEDEWSFLDAMFAKFARAGYIMPNVVMWNVASRADRYLDTLDNKHIQFISGSSPSAFKSLIRGANFTAQELMLDVLSDPMYANIMI